MNVLLNHISVPFSEFRIKNVLLNHISVPFSEFRIQYLCVLLSQQCPSLSSEFSIFMRHSESEFSIFMLTCLCTLQFVKISLNSPYANNLSSENSVSLSVFSESQISCWAACGEDLTRFSICRIHVELPVCFPAIPLLMSFTSSLIYPRRRLI